MVCEPARKSLYAYLAHAGAFSLDQYVGMLIIRIFYHEDAEYLKALALFARRILLAPIHSWGHE